MRGRWTRSSAVWSGPETWGWDSALGSGAGAGARLVSSGVVGSVMVLRDRGPRVLFGSRVFLFELRVVLRWVGLTMRGM